MLRATFKKAEKKVASLMPHFVHLLFAALIALSFAAPAFADPEKHHALSLVREPKYPADFKHFDGVNPNAPKGGTVRLASAAPYDNLNPAVFRGNIAPGVSRGADLVFEALMVTSREEGSTQYCLLCEWVSFPEDRSSVTFKLREGARWHDGVAVTVEDVLFSMDVAKGRDTDTGAPWQPLLAQYYKNVVKGEKTGEHEVTFTFDVSGNRELPFIVGELVVYPKHWWEGRDESGKPRDISKTSLEPPLGSGPYKVKATRPGEWIAFERVPAYWGRDLPVRAGENNFDTLEFQYYGDLNVSMEAFKAGQYDFRAESSAKAWATAYDFPALREGKVVKREVTLETPKPMQGFVFNIRRPKFEDVRVRRAFNLAFDFEWTNQNLFFGQYTRTNSFFEGQELASKGLPSSAELELLEPLRDKIPPEVFTEEFRNPVNKDPADFRTNLRQAARLLKEAGYKVVNNKLVSPKGEPFTVEFLIESEAFQRVILPYVENLRRLGIDANVRLVDSTEMKRREDTFDFDIIVGVFAQSESPGNEQREFWSSSAADQTGSRNVIGIKNPAIDTLVDKIIFAPNRDALVTACRALDRVLLWSAFVIPQWHSATARIAYWNKFGSPDPLPKLVVGFPDVWWFDAELAAKNGLK
ncbi:extracellular solute-binding protein family 5 [Rhodomicrobium vannielii ATCC 17100]|uniref:Extracellular solute-binding protein family 5 n=1 Tax=Rhodomicrobium vannielii (strain ATCC 17100 / DSM 162 / LMG 4299 / NCIMB 10020 / ATH 3.1.1) TaxID=648757 RepID=E3HZ53_RHOVT|nr:extracellular solute-binding protein [Rhodomicrobium vannielii]ADP72100.1 extracellular solute-binding protein family 5 [Rhodomicrobium vannielii ATCC 17100]